MTKKEKISLLKRRLSILDSRDDKNVKSPGVRNKVARRIKKMEKEMNEYN